MRPYPKLKPTTIVHHRQKHAHTTNTTVSTVTDSDIRNGRRPDDPRRRVRARDPSLFDAANGENGACARRSTRAMRTIRFDSRVLARSSSSAVGGRRRRARDGVLPGVFAIARARMGDARRRAREGMTRERATRKRWMDIVDADAFSRDGVEGRRRARRGGDGAMDDGRVTGRKALGRAARADGNGKD